MSEINAIATNNYLLATQQEVSHDNSLSGNGTVDSPLGVVPGYNETVLCSTQINPNHATETLSESAFNFNMVRLRCTSRYGAVFYAFFDPAGRSCNASVTDVDSSSIRIQGAELEIASDGLSITLTSNYQLLGTTLSVNDGRFYCTVSEVVGINRISG